MEIEDFLVTIIRIFIDNVALAFLFSDSCGMLEPLTHNN
jgi:hypothetical protein